jgi:hypothetical protein
VVGLQLIVEVDDAVQVVKSRGTDFESRRMWVRTGSAPSSGAPLVHRRKSQFGPQFALGKVPDPDVDVVTALGPPSVGAVDKESDEDVQVIGTTHSR